MHRKSKYLCGAVCGPCTRTPPVVENVGVSFIRMIRKINYGENSERYSPIVVTQVFTNECISGPSLLDLKDRKKMNDRKHILEFMQRRNIKNTTSLRRHSV